MLPTAGLFMHLVPFEPDDLSEQALREAVLAHHVAGEPRPGGGELDRAVGLDDEQPVALHPGHRLRDGGAGLVEPLRAQRYDFILATYSLHHLTDAEKVPFLNGLLALLQEDGEILIGDVAFHTRVELEACKTQAGASWDEDEIYFVADELAPAFPQLKFVPFSACAGILSLRR